MRSRQAPRPRSSMSVAKHPGPAADSPSRSPAPHSPAPHSPAAPPSPSPPDPQPSSDFQLGDLVIVRYSTYPYWPATVDMTHQEALSGAHRANRRTRAGDVVDSYWCTFANEDTGGWIRFDRIVRFHPDLIDAIRLPPSDGMFKDQQNAIRVALTSYNRLPASARAAQPPQALPADFDRVLVDSEDDLMLVTEDENDTRIPSDTPVRAKTKSRSVAKRNGPAKNSAPDDDDPMDLGASSDEDSPPQHPSKPSAKTAKRARTSTSTANQRRRTSNTPNSTPARNSRGVSRPSSAKKPRKTPNKRKPAASPATSRDSKRTKTSTAVKSETARTAKADPSKAIKQPAVPATISADADPEIESSPSVTPAKRGKASKEPFEDNEDPGSDSQSASDTPPRTGAGTGGKAPAKLPSNRKATARQSAADEDMDDDDQSGDDNHKPAVKAPASESKEAHGNDVDRDDDDDSQFNMGEGSDSLDVTQKGEDQFRKHLRSVRYKMGKLKAELAASEKRVEEFEALTGGKDSRVTFKLPSAPENLCVSLPPVRTYWTNEVDAEEFSSVMDKLQNTFEEFKKMVKLAEAARMKLQEEAIKMRAQYEDKCDGVMKAEQEAVEKERELVRSLKQMVAYKVDVADLREHRAGYFVKGVGLTCKQMPAVNTICHEIQESWRKQVLLHIAKKKDMEESVSGEANGGEGAEVKGEDSLAEKRDDGKVGAEEGGGGGEAEGCKEDKGEGGKDEAEEQKERDVDMEEAKSDEGKGAEEEEEGKVEVKETDDDEPTKKVIDGDDEDAEDEEDGDDEGDEEDEEDEEEEDKDKDGGEAVKGDGKKDEEAGSEGRAEEEKGKFAGKTVVKKEKHSEANGEAEADKGSEEGDESDASPTKESSKESSKEPRAVGAMEDN